MAHGRPLRRINCQAAISAELLASPSVRGAVLIGLGRICCYGLYRQIKSLDHECIVVAPSLIPKKPG